MARHSAAQAVLHKKLSRKEKRTAFDIFIYFFTFATPLFEVPQAMAIYTRHDAHNVSLFTWGFFCIANFAWMAYGLRNKLVPVVLMAILYEIIELSIVIGIFRYS